MTVCCSTYVCLQSYGVPSFIASELLQGLTATYPTINDALNNAFITNWTFSIDYSQYFAQCAPTQCTYFQVQSTPVIEALSVVIGLLGGLSISIRLLVQTLAAGIAALYSWRCRCASCCPCFHCRCCCCCDIANKQRVDSTATQDSEAIHMQMTPITTALEPDG